MNFNDRGFHMTFLSRRTTGLAMMGTVSAMLMQAPVNAQQFKQKIRENPAACNGMASAVRVNISGVESGSGTIRVQLYRGIKSDWLESGRWLNRIEVPARAGSMSVCMPAPGPGVYGIAVRHDTNGNGKTDLTKDGGAMSNNPSINIWNLGKPSFQKTAFRIGTSVKAISVTMKYA